MPAWLSTIVQKNKQTYTIYIIVFSCQISNQSKHYFTKSGKILTDFFSFTGQGITLCRLILGYYHKECMAMPQFCQLKNVNNLRHLSLLTRTIYIRIRKCQDKQHELLSYSSHSPKNEQGNKKMPL